MYLLHCELHMHALATDTTSGLADHDINAACLLAHTADASTPGVLNKGEIVKP
jgi:hypothetical protein